MRAKTVRQRPRASKQRFQGAIYMPKEWIGQRVMVLNIKEFNALYGRVRIMKKVHGDALRKLKFDIKKCISSIGK